MRRLIVSVFFSLPVFLFAADPPAPAPNLGIQAQLDKAIADGARHVRLQPGAYRLGEPLRILNAADLVVDGTGVYLVFTVSNLKAIQIARSKNLTVKGLTIDFDPLPFVQGAVTRIKPEEGYIEMTVEDGYSDLNDTYLQKNTAHVFDRESGLWKVRGSNRMATRIRILTPRQARIFLTPEAMYLIQDADPVVRLGDLVIINTRAHEGMSVVECENFTLDGTVFHTCAGIAVLGRYSTGTHTIRNVKITPGPRPKGAAYDRLISTCADAVNYMGLRGKLVIENCEFARMADDTLNICGVTTKVLRVEDDRTFLGSLRKPEYLQNNDLVKFLAPEDLSPAGEVLLASAEVQTMTEDEIMALLAGAKVQAADSLLDSMEIVRIRLHEPVAMKVGQHVDFPAFSTGGFEVRNSYFHDHRARGLRVQVSNGLIEGNRFERIQHAAMTIGPEDTSTGTGGAGWLTNIVVRKNTIVDVGRGQHIAQPRSGTPAAITTDSAKFRFLKPTYPGYRNIVIEDNTIDGCRVAAIHACSVDGLTIRNNTIARVNTIDTTDVARDVGLRPSHAVNVYWSRDVKVEGNKASDLGKHCQGDVLIQPPLPGKAAASEGVRH